MKVKKLLIPLGWVIKHTKQYRLVILMILISNLLTTLIRLKLAVSSKDLVDMVFTQGGKEAIHTGVVFLAFLGTQIALSTLSKGLSIWNLEAVSNQLRSGLYEHLTKTSWIEYKKYHTGDILTRMTSDVGIVTESIIREVPEFISRVVSLVSAFVILCFYDSMLAVLGLITGPVILMLGLIFSTKFLNIYTTAQVAESKFRAYAQESLEHMLVIKTFCSEQESKSRWNHLLKNKMRSTLKKKAAMAIVGVVIIGTCGVLYLPIIIKIGYELMKGIITYGDLVAYIQLLVLMQSPIIGLTTSIQKFTATTASVKRLMELEELKTEQIYVTSDHSTLTQIQLDHVNFHYISDSPVLSNLNMQIALGDVIGLVGKSGEGKTTLIHLLMQILSPCSGEIMIKEKEKEAATANGFIRKYISYVPQGNTLFSGTISQNLVIGCPTATKEEQMIALKAAGAWDFVDQTPKGIDTVIGERGMGLSEGQAQRLAIARALLRKAPILILDEATSALDAETEKEVLKEIFKDKTRTFILITHRASILSFCNRVWKLSKGVITEETIDSNEVAATKVIEIASHSFV